MPRQIDFENVTIVLPPADHDRISEDLRGLTRLLTEGGHADRYPGGLLGGEWGYGVHFENDTFLMHPYCWCGADDCPWCLGCTCPDGAIRYFLADGTETDADTFFDSGGYLTGTSEPVPEAECPLCKGLLFRAPNFFHKPSGSRVYWYKWLGRSMEGELHTDWAAILDDCLTSLVT